MRPRQIGGLVVPTPCGHPWAGVGHVVELPGRVRCGACGAEWVDDATAHAHVVDALRTTEARLVALEARLNRLEAAGGERLAAIEHKLVRLALEAKVVRLEAAERLAGLEAKIVRLEAVLLGLGAEIAARLGGAP